MKIVLSRAQFIIHILCPLPLFVILVNGFTDSLSANPIQDITIRTGLTALDLLLLSLCCTPINKIFGLKFPLKIRRAIGLYAFFYAFIHFFIFTVLDYGLQFDLIIPRLFQQPFIFSGLIGFILLIPLAITSITSLRIRLGKTWKTIQRFVYFIVGFVLIHFFLAIKGEKTLPFLYLLLYTFLLALRLPIFIRRNSQISYLLKIDAYLTSDIVRMG